MAKDFVEPTFTTRCEICGTPYNQQQWPYQIQGVDACAGCSGRTKAVVHYVRFVRVIATRDCERILSDVHGRLAYQGTWCDLDCKCDPCTARRVIRWHKKFANL